MSIINDSIGRILAGRYRIESTPSTEDPPDGTASAPDAETGDVMALAEAVGVTDVPRPRSARRFGWKAALVALSVAIVIGGGTFAVLRTTPSAPSIPRHRLPSLDELTVAQATHRLSADHLAVYVVMHRSSMTVAAGEILRQIPGSGTSLKEGALVGVVLSSGPPLEAVPALTQTTGDCPAIISMLAAAHLGANCSDINSTAVPSGTVITWNPSGHTLEGSVITVTVSSGPPLVTVPALTQLSGGCSTVTSVLSAAQLQTTCSDVSSTSVPKGSVIDSSPTGSVPEGSVITVNVSSGPATESIPSLTGATCAGATTTLGRLGLHAQCTNAYNQTVPAGQVISWSPTGTALQGATIVVRVSLGPPPVIVPTVVGLTVAQAISALEASGLVPGSLQGPLSGTVFESDPAQGASVPQGTSVVLYSR